MTVIPVKFGGPFVGQHAPQILSIVPTRKTGSMPFVQKLVVAVSCSAVAGLCLGIGFAAYLNSLPEPKHAVPMECGFEGGDCR